MFDNRVPVIHLVESLDDTYGGPAKSIPYTAFYSETQDFKHFIVSCDSPSACNTLVDRLNVKWIKVARFGPAKICFSPKLINLLVKIYLANHKQVYVHLHNNWNFVALAAYLFSFLPNTKLVISPRGSLDPWSLNQGKLRKKVAGFLFVKNMYKRAKMIHVTADHERSAVEGFAKTLSIRLIPNGITSTESKSSNIKRERSSVLFLSRIHKKKGLDILINSWALAQKPETARLVVAGDFESENYRIFIQKLIEDLNLNTVEFLGHVDTGHRIELMNRCGLFALPSHAENFGISICEALSCGMPVMTSKYTPWSSVQTNNCGWYLDNTVENVVASLEEYFRMDERAYQQISDNAKKLAAQFEWEGLAPRYREMYSALTDN